MKTTYAPPDLEKDELTRARFLRGTVAILAVVALSLFLGRYLPQFGAAIIAMLLGLAARNVFGLGRGFTRLNDFLTQRALKGAIILLGGTVTLQGAVALSTGYLPLILIAIATGVSTALVAGRVFGVPGRLSLLIGAGTAICGATAILASSPVIRARREETAYAIATIFLVNLAAMLSLPLVGNWLGLGQATFGAWAGVAIHDTSSVLAAAFAFGDESGQTATVVKLARTLMLVPFLFLVAIAGSGRGGARASTGAGSSDGRAGGGAGRAIIKAFPWFILGFLAMAVLSSIGLFAPDLRDFFGDASKLMIVFVLAAVGFGTDLQSLRRLGARALVVAAGASVLAAVGCLLILLA